MDLTDTKFHGGGFTPELDQVRLVGQLGKIQELTADNDWYTLAEISEATGAPEASASAALRSLRNQHKFTVNKRRRGEPGNGLWEYQVLPPAKVQPELFNTEGTCLKQ